MTEPRERVTSRSNSSISLKTKSAPTIQDIQSRNSKKREVGDLLLQNNADLLSVLCQTKFSGEEAMTLVVTAIQLLQFQDPIKGPLQFLERALIDKITLFKSKNRHLGEVMRDNSITTMLFTVFARQEGKQYIQETLGSILNEIQSYADQMEIDPAKIKVTEDTGNELQSNGTRLRRACNSILDAIYENADRMPTSIRQMLCFLGRMMRDPEVLAFLKSEKISESLTPSGSNLPSAPSFTPPSAHMSRQASGQMSPGAGWMGPTISPHSLSPGGTMKGSHLRYERATSWGGNEDRKRLPSGSMPESSLPTSISTMTSSLAYTSGSSKADVTNHDIMDQVAEATSLIVSATQTMPPTTGRALDLGTIRELGATSGTFSATPQTNASGFQLGTPSEYVQPSWIAWQPLYQTLRATGSSTPDAVPATNHSALITSPLSRSVITSGPKSQDSIQDTNSPAIYPSSPKIIIDDKPIKHSPPPPVTSDNSLVRLTRPTSTVNSSSAGSGVGLPGLIVTATSDAEDNQEQTLEVWERVIATVVFLRFFIPVITNPEGNNILTPGTKLSSDERRGFILCGKVLTNVCHQVSFGRKEPHMMLLNDFIAEHRDELRRFLAHISSSAFSEKTVSNLSRNSSSSSDDQPGQLKKDGTQSTSTKLGKVFKSLPTLNSTLANSSKKKKRDEEKARRSASSLPPATNLSPANEIVPTQTTATTEKSTRFSMTNLFRGKKKTAISAQSTSPGSTTQNMSSSQVEDNFMAFLQRHAGRLEKDFLDLLGPFSEGNNIWSLFYQVKTLVDTETWSTIPIVMAAPPTTSKPKVSSTSKLLARLGKLSIRSLLQSSTTSNAAAAAIESDEQEQEIPSSAIDKLKAKSLVDCSTPPPTRRTITRTKTTAAASSSTQRTSWVQ